MSGDDAFRLPYWAWEKEGQNVLPAPFREAMYQGAANPLFDATRVQAVNRGQPLRPHSPSGSFATDWEAALATTHFTRSVLELSYGGLQTAKATMGQRPASSRSHGVMEARAHDLVHDAVGGAEGNMGDPDTAARDPIFWLHHANVDRLWNRWLDNKNHHLPDPVADKDWYDQAFPFYDESGKPVVVTVREILKRAGDEARYDDDPRILAAAPAAAREKAMEPKIVSLGAVQPMLKLTTTTFTKTLELGEDARPKLMAALAAPRAATEPPAVLLRVEGIKPPKDVRLTFDVFLLKRGEKPSKRSYVGPISFFGRRGDGAHGHGDGEGFTQGFDVTGMVEKLRTANKGRLPDLEVAVVPHSTAGLSDADLAKTKIEVPIANITLKLVEPEKK
jgi:tyrosinase